MSDRVARLLAAMVLFLLTAGCQADGPWVEVAGARYQVEIAADDATRARGLMFVDSMPDDEGMLFIWRTSEPRSMWMRNTRIPLDILFIGADRTIVAWSLDTPPCRTRRCPSYPSGVPAKYVLELNGGQIEALGAAIGDPVVFGNIPGEADG